MRNNHNILSKILVILLIFIFPVNIYGCKSKEKEEEKEKKFLNLYVDTKDKYSLNIIKYLIDDYKVKNPDLNISLNNGLANEDKILEDINKGNEIDIIFTNRNNMIELSKKGLIGDLGTNYKKALINDRYYDIISSYGRVGEKYYGMPLNPYSIEFLYNKKKLDALNIKYPINMEQWMETLRIISNKGIRTPIVLTEDTDIYNAFAGFVASNSIEVRKLEEVYDSGEDCYNKIKEVQKVFSNVNDLVKRFGLSKNSFENGNDMSIDNFVGGEIPLLVSISYYSSKLNNPNIGLIDDFRMNGGYRGSIPILVNCLMCVPINSKNGENANEFIKYIFNEDAQGKLLQQGMITGNKKVNEKVGGIGKNMVEHLYKSDDNSMYFAYNFPIKLQVKVSYAINRIFEGRYSGNEWEEMLEECYKLKR